MPAAPLSGDDGYGTAAAAAVPPLVSRRRRRRASVPGLTEVARPGSPHRGRFVRHGEYVASSSAGGMSPTGSKSRRLSSWLTESSERRERNANASYERHGPAMDHHGVTEAVDRHGEGIVVKVSDAAVQTGRSVKAAACHRPAVIPASPSRISRTGDARRGSSAPCRSPSASPPCRSRSCRS